MHKKKSAIPKRRVPRIKRKINLQRMGQPVNMSMIITYIVEDTQMKLINAPAKMKLSYLIYVARPVRNYLVIRPKTITSSPC